jgi:DNA polymerase III epsilon subunit-like protein
MDNFVAIDFETANFAQSSVCSVGMVIVKNGEIAEEDGSQLPELPYSERD